MAKRMQYCHYCAEELGVYDSYPGDTETCGKRECNRSAADIERARRQEAHEQLDEQMGWSC